MARERYQRLFAALSALRRYKSKHFKNLPIETKMKVLKKMRDIAWTIRQEMHLFP